MFGKEKTMNKPKTLSPRQLKRLGFNLRKSGNEWFCLGAGGYLEYVPALNELKLIVDEMYIYNLSPDYKDVKNFMELNKDFE